MKKAKLVSVSKIKYEMIYISSAQKRIIKESCQNNFNIPACLPTEIDIVFLHQMHIRGTLEFFFLDTNNMTNTIIS